MTLTRDEHVDIAAELGRVHDWLGSLVERLSDRYGVDHRLPHRVRQVSRTITVLRLELAEVNDAERAGAT